MSASGGLIDRRNVTVRQMKAEEVKEVFEIIDLEGWNLNLQKLELLFQARPSAFYVLLYNDEIIVTYSLMETYDKEYSLGNLVVKKSARGQGLGKWIMTEIIHQIPYKVITLTAVPESKEFYEKIGMQLTEPQQRHVIAHMEVDVENLEAKLASCHSQLENIRLSMFDSSKIDDLISYDNSVRTYDNKFHTRVVAQYCHVVMAEDLSTNCTVGYAASFLHRNEIVFDGVFADSDAVALILLRESLRHFPGVSKFKLQMFQPKQLLKETGHVTETYDYIRFSYGVPTFVPEEKVYCVSDCDYTV